MDRWTLDQLLGNLRGRIPDKDSQLPAEDLTHLDHAGGGWGLPQRPARLPQILFPKGVPPLGNNTVDAGEPRSRVKNVRDERRWI